MENMPINEYAEGVARERRLSKWIIVLLILASAVMIAQGAYNLSNLQKVDTSIDSVYQTARRLDALARELAKPIADVRLLSKQMVLSPNEVIARETEIELETRINAVEKSVQLLKEIPRQMESGQHYIGHVDAIVSAWKSYLFALGVTQKYQREGVRVAAFLSVTKQEKLVYEALQQSISDFSRVLLRQSRGVYEEAHAKSKTAFYTLLFTVVIEILILKFILYFVWRMFRTFIRSSNAHEQAIEKERTQLQRTLDTSPVGVGVTIDSKFVYTNEKLKSMLDIDVGDDVTGIYVDSAKRPQILERVAREQVVPSLEMQLHGKNGAVLDTLSTFYGTEYNGKSGILAWLVDVTDLKAVERQSVSARNLAEEATKAKSDFLANMSHEIRTPMNAIIGLSELALETNLTAKQRNYISKVHLSAESLLGIINDILDFSKIEAGKLNMEMVSFNLDDLLQNLVNMLGYKAEEKHLEVLFDIPQGLPETLVGDPLRLSQILINLGNNAVKFTETGEVVVRINVLSRSDDSIGLQFEIVDTGIGIAQDKLATLFHSFTQADTSTSRKFGGTGLGLAISKSLVELMGGELHCASEEGVGSRFSFELNFAISCSGVVRMQPSEIQAMRVLVVDDNVSSREIMGSSLRSFGLLVDLVPSGSDALDALRKADMRLEPYELIVMDWKMPAMDGVETVRLIQTDHKLKVQPAVIMITAFGRDGLVDALEDVDIQGSLTKPVTPSALLDTILTVKGLNELIPLRKGSQNTDFEIAVQTLAGAKVLLVEDNDINMELAVDILQKHNIHVTTAINGRLALDVLARDTFDGVLMDCQMPVMDGYEATRLIRSEKKYEGLPVLAMTANAMAGDKEKVLAVGMNDHIPKPLQRAELFSTMARWIRPANPEIPHRESSFNDGQLDIEAFPPIAGLNTSVGLDICQNNIPLYTKLIGKFAAKGHAFKSEFDAALLSDDKRAPMRCAHTLKGVAGNIGALAAQREAANLEVLCSDHADSAKVQEALESLLAELGLVSVAIDHYLESVAIRETPTEELDFERELEQLGTLVVEFDAEALELVGSMLQGNLTAPQRELLVKVSQRLDDFDFDGAQALLEEWR